MPISMSAGRLGAARRVPRSVTGIVQPDVAAVGQERLPRHAEGLDGAHRGLPFIARRPLRV